jgi:hypothetical protein
MSAVVSLALDVVVLSVDAYACACVVCVRAGGVRACRMCARMCAHLCCRDCIRCAHELTMQLD